MVTTPYLVTLSQDVVFNWWPLTLTGLSCSWRRRWDRRRPGRRRTTPGPLRPTTWSDSSAHSPKGRTSMLSPFGIDTNGQRERGRTYVWGEQELYTAQRSFESQSSYQEDSENNIWQGGGDINCLGRKCRNIIWLLDGYPHLISTIWILYSRANKVRKTKCTATSVYLSGCLNASDCRDVEHDPGTQKC